MSRFRPIIPSILILASAGTLYIQAENFENALKVFRLLVLLFVPGMEMAIIVGRKLRMCIDEIIVLDLLFSMALSMFLMVYWSFLLPSIQSLPLYLSLALLVPVSGLLISYFLREISYEEDLFRDSRKRILTIICAFLIGFLPAYLSLPKHFWRAWDPWLNVPIGRIIAEEGLNPWELDILFQNIVGNLDASGFYYFFSSISVFTHFDYYWANRLGGPILSGIVSMISFLIFRTSFSNLPSLTACFLLFLNPFFIIRYSMTLRENFSITFLLAIILLLCKADDNSKSSRRACYLSVGFFLSSIISTHHLTFIISMGMFLGLLLFDFVKKSFMQSIVAFMPSFLLGVPYWKYFLNVLMWVYKNWVERRGLLLAPLIAFIFFSFLFCFLFSKRLGLRKGRFNLGQFKWGYLFYVAMIILILGALFQVFFPTAFEVLSLYNPPISKNMFATSTLIISCLGLMSIIILSALGLISIPIHILSFSLVVLAIFNVPNIDVAFPLFRLVLYVSWVMTYSSALFMEKISEIIHNLIGDAYKIFSNVSRHNSRSGIYTLFAKFWFFFFLVGLVSWVVVYNLQAIQPGYANFIETDIESAKEFFNFARDDFVLPQRFVHELLLYTGLHPDRLILRRAHATLYATDNITWFREELHRISPDAECIYVIIMARWAHRTDLQYVNIEILSYASERMLVGTLIVYTIPLT